LQPLINFLTQQPEVDRLGQQPGGPIVILEIGLGLIVSFIGPAAFVLGDHAKYL
jgi:hypothetical protein